MIDYKKKILKYKIKYLNEFILKKKKIYGGDFTEEDIDPEYFLNTILTKITVIAYTTRTLNTMLQRLGKSGCFITSFPSIYSTHFIAI